jgi:hypothetical protein
MATYHTNPRQIISIPAEAIQLFIKRNKETSSVESFTFGGVDLSGVYGAKTIKNNAKIVLEIRSKHEQQRVELGTIENPEKCQDVPFTILNRSSLSWHLFIAENYEIRASNERVHPKDECIDEESMGLVLVEPVELGEAIWRVYPQDGIEEPKILINNDVELNLIARLKENSVYRAVIFQNAVEQIVRILANSPGDGAEGEWQEKWHNYFSANDMEEHPKEEDELDVDIEIWIDRVVEKISVECSLLSELKKLENR